MGDLMEAGPFRTTSLQQIEYGNAGNSAEFAQAIGFTPRSMDEMLAAHPAQTQDLWHARLYLLRPLLTASLVMMWLGSGMMGLLNPPQTTLTILKDNLGLPAALISAITVATSLLDIAIAWLVLKRRRRQTGIVQIATVLAYTIGLTMIQPVL